MSAPVESYTPGFHELGSFDFTVLMDDYRHEESGATLWICDECSAVVGPDTDKHSAWHDES